MSVCERGSTFSISIGPALKNAFLKKRKVQIVFIHLKVTVSKSESKFKTLTLFVCTSSTDQSRTDDNSIYKKFSHKNSIFDTQVIK